MGKVAFVFPGQGAQYAGMGKDFYEQLPVSREVFERASRATGLDIPALCFEENEKLNITEYTQAAMLAVSAAILAALKEQEICPDVTAGLSLGEYGALIASGVMDPEDAFRVVRKRGILMQDAVPSGGAMAAVLGLTPETVTEICRETEGAVSVANYNCPGQTVITGEEKAVADASDSLKTAGAKRVVPLKVSGPFHSPMMAEAGEKLREVLKPVEIHSIAVPYLTNVTGDYVTDPAQVKDLLSKQVSAPVLWQAEVERMIRDGVTLFVEVGPGKSLTGFLKKIDRNARGIYVGTVEEFDQAVECIRKENQSCEE